VPKATWQLAAYENSDDFALAATHCIAVTNIRPPGNRTIVTGRQPGNFAKTGLNRTDVKAE